MTEHTVNATFNPETQAPYAVAILAHPGAVDENAVARVSDTAGQPAAADAPSTSSQSSAILDGVAAWVQRSPRVMRLLSGLGRRIAPILTMGRNHVFVLGANEVREALVRGSDFELGPCGGPKMLMGPFLLGMDPRKQYLDERGLIEQILKDLLEPLQNIAREEASKCGDALTDKQSIDIVDDFAEPIVRRIACRFFGIGVPRTTDTAVLAPATGDELLSQWVRKVGSVIATSAPAPFGLLRVADACAVEFRAFLEREIGRQLDDPDPRTVLGQLLLLAKAGKLSPERVLPNLAGLLFAGSTPLVKSITHAIDQTLGRLDDLPVTRDDQTLKGLLFEALRFNPTFPVVLRYCPFTKLLGGGRARREVPAGASLYVALAGALFDAEINDADQFMAGRPADEDSSLVFGWGQHHCLGRHVATAQLIEMLRAFLALPNLAQFRRSRIRYDGPAVDRFVISRSST